MDISQNPTDVLPRQKKHGCLKGCGCFLVILLFLTVGGVGSLYFFGDKLISQVSMNKAVDLVYFKWIRPEVEKQLAAYPQKERRALLEKADRVVVTFEKLDRETQKAILWEALTFIKNQQQGKITPPDQIQHLSKFLKDQDLFPSF